MASESTRALSRSTGSGRCGSCLDQAEYRSWSWLAVEGPGGVQASFDFRGARNDVAGRMLTVTLTNDLDGTVYA
jgi:hypothetical protein